jgi:hypothetical protein
MDDFWDLFIEPILILRRPQSVVEVGAEFGRTTRLLLGFCDDHSAALHCIDPSPRFDPALLGHGGRLVLHRGRSLQVLPQVDRFDVVLLDGDHNWYTVYHELKLIEGRCKDLGQAFPVVLLHDVGWPYGRRDLYYDPDTIPPQYRHPCAKKGVVLGVSALQERGGMNAHLWHADHEDGPRNGVLTAVEDFVKDAGQPLQLVTVPGLFGFAVLFAADLQAEHEALVKFLRALELPPALKQHLQRCESLRLATEGRLRECDAALRDCQAGLAALGRSGLPGSQFEVGFGS